MSRYRKEDFKNKIESFNLTSTREPVLDNFDEIIVNKLY